MMQYLTIKEAAELAHVSRRTLGRWRTAKRIRFITFGRSIRIDSASLREFLDRRARPQSKCAINIGINVNIFIGLKSPCSSFPKLKEAQS